MPTFINTAILGGIGLIAIPIIIHLLQKNRVKEMEWAAMKFLLEIVEEQNKKIQIEDILLLILRVLMILFLALALSRPVLNFTGGGLLDANGEVVVLLDTSYSMRTLQGSESRFDVAKKRLSKLLEAQPKGYQLSLVKMNQFPSSQTGGFITDKDLLLQTVKKIKPGALKGNVDSSISYALKQFSDKEGQKKLYILSDFQKSDWSNLSAELRDKMKNISKKVSIFCIPVDDDVVENLAVEKIDINQAAAKVGQRVGVLATIRNFGSEASKDLPVDILLNGELVDSKNVTVPPGQTNQVMFQITPDVGGDLKIEVRIKYDKVDADNSRFFTLRVIDQIKVLAVLDAGVSSSDFHPLLLTELALNPYKLRSKDDRAIYKFDYQSISNLTSLNLSDYGLILMADIRDITAIDVEPLQNYVAKGGGVFMFLGKNVNPATYNANLYKEGKGLWKLKLMDRTLKQPVEDRVLDFQGKNEEHPIWQYILSGGRNYLQTIRIFESYAFEPQDVKDSVVLASAKVEGQAAEFPVFMDFKFGLGHFVVYGSSGGTEWGALPVHPIFPGMVHQIVKYLRSFSEPSLNISVYDEVRKVIAFEESQANFMLSSPSGQAYTISPLAESEEIYSLKLTSEQLSEHGFYELKNVENNQVSSIIAANINIAEGNVETMKKMELEATLKTQGVVVDTSGEAMSVVLNQIDPMVELAALFLLLAFLCWMAENFVAYRITKRS